MAVDVKTFATLLAKALMKRGIPREIAVKHAVSLVRTFDEEDLREISSYTSAEEFDDLTDSLADLIKDKEPVKKSISQNEEDKKTASSSTGEFVVLKKGEVQDPPMGATQKIPVQKSASTEIFDLPKKGNEPEASIDATREIPVQNGDAPSEGLEHMKTKAFRLENGEIPPEHTQQFSGLKTSDITLRSDTSSDITMVNIPAVAPYTEEEEQEIYLDGGEEEEKEKVVLTKRGKAFFWSIAVATSPITLLIAILVLGVFALGIICVCALIAAFLLLVCGEAVVGCGLTLVGVIYGAIEIVSGNAGVGLYEIGLGICCGGIALCLGILTYNFAVLVLPYVLKQLITFEGYCLKRVGPMINRFREECNRL